MGKTFGIIALIFGIIGVIMIIIDIYLAFMFVIMSPFITPPFFIQIIIEIISIACTIVAIVCGAIGIKKDDSRGLAIAGLILGTIGMIPVIISIISVFGMYGFTFF